MQHLTTVAALLAIATLITGLVLPLVSSRGSRPPS